MKACLHTYIHTYVYILHMHCTYNWMPGMFCGRVSLSTGEWVFRLFARDAWVFMGAFMTSGSGSIDIWFPSQSEGYLIVWVWSDKGGGLQYILTLNWGKEAEQATKKRLRRSRNQESNWSTERHPLPGIMKTLTLLFLCGFLSVCWSMGGKDKPISSFSSFPILPSGPFGTM